LVDAELSLGLRRMLADICAATDLVAAKNLERNPTPLQKDGRVFWQCKTGVASRRHV
jgi:hypothetical protein